MIVAWVLYALLIGGCAVVAAAAMEPLCAAHRIARRAPWVAALVVAIVVPLLMAVRPVALPTLSADGQAYLSTLSSSTLDAPPVTGWTWDQLILAVWGIGSLVVAAVIAEGSWRLHRAARGAATTTLDGEVVALTRDVGPGVRFFGTPRILLPSRLAALESGRRALLVRHEREHLRAGDPHLLMLSLAALGAMPWNPALWFIARRLRAALELDCDARVLSAGGDVHDYGNLLLTVAASRQSPRLPAYLAFAASQSPLERRIRAMTNPRPSLGAASQCALGLAIAASIVTGCEARRPEPLAPVSSYTIVDGAAKPAAAATAAQADAMRDAVSTALRVRGPSFGAGGTLNDPLVMIHDADGNVVMTGRLGARTANGTPAFDSIPVAASEIASVDVIKSASLLPPEAKAGLIRIVLKPGARSATQPSSAATPSAAPSAAPSIAPYGITEPSASRASPAAGGRARVIVLSHEGRELYRKVLTLAPASGAGSPFDGLPVATEDIASVEVTKPDASGVDLTQGIVTITLKPGRGISAGR
ncbi:MAG: M56 family metallopeptidase [Gemmatimonadaceae bacterium]|nr:M56 family metallopeptidase [Gemmatimonadaceae bacterium]